MNPNTVNTVNTDWVPGETDDWLREAIDRVRAECAAESDLLARGATEGATRDTRAVYERSGHPGADYAVGEWYHNHRIIAGDELAGVYRRMKRRGEYTTDEPIGRGAPTTLTVIRGGKA